MTILTKPFGDKKPEKLSVPLVGVPPSAPNDLHNRDLEAEHVDNNGYVIHLQRRTVPTLLLLLTALFVLGLGIIGGVYIYREYAHARMQRIRFHGFCGVPYDTSSIDNKALVLMNSKWRDDADANFVAEPSIDFLKQFSNDLQQLRELNDDYFNEEFELDDEEGYEKITVPDFRDGRHGRFIHDFKRNQSSIIDKDKNRCFVMPLDRDTVLPPYSLFDLIRKMYNGYYDIDTDIVKQDYRVVTPAVSDMSQISDRIANECEDMKIYMLEKYITGVYKRSVAELPQEGKYAQFSGKNIVHMNIVNINELNEYEKSLA